MLLVLHSQVDGMGEAHIVLHVPIANAYELQDVDTKEVLASLLQHIQNKEYSYD